MSAFIAVAIKDRLENSIRSLGKIGVFRLVSPQENLQTSLQSLMQGRILIALVDEDTGDTAHTLMDERLSVKERLAKVSEAIEILMRVCQETGFKFFVVDGIPSIDDILVTKTTPEFEVRLADALVNFEVPDLCLDL